MSRKLASLISILLIAAIVLPACAPAAAPAPAPQIVPQTVVVPQTVAVPQTVVVPATAAPAKKVEINWWHISTKDPGLTYWQKLADDYMATHPNVTVKITVLENEAFKTKLTTVMQSGNPPDIFQSWGGGTMVEQAKAGLLKDISADMAANNGAWKNTFAQGALGVYAYQGKQYGVPWDMGMVGWWYNKDLFAKAGIQNTPKTWTEFLDVVKKLKAAGITPIALGEKDSWTGMHIWSYLATRIGGQAAFEAALNRKGSFADPAFVQAFEKLDELIALQPFQAGYLGATHDEMQATFGNGKAAMELSGQWAPSVESANAADKKGVANLGMFGFPAVEGGTGDATDVIGGGNGFAIGKNAPQEAIDFVKYLTTASAQSQMASLGMGIPVVKGSEVGLKDANMVEVQKAFAAAKYFQLYYDQFLPSAVGEAINSNVQTVFAGTAKPEQAAQAIEDAAKKYIK
jgi:raffinose/stachyose/melibiose transport system substrate-binding protein